MPTTKIEVLASFDQLVSANKELKDYNRTVQRTIELSEKLGVSTTNVTRSAAGMSRAQADILVNLTKANNALLEQINLNTKGAVATRTATQASTGRARAVSDEAKELEKKAALEAKYYRELDANTRREAAVRQRQRDERIATEQAITKAFESEMNKRAAIANRDWKSVDRQKAAVTQALGGYAGTTGYDPLNMTTAQTRRAAQATVQEMNSWFREGSRAGKQALNEYLGQIKETQAATDSAAVSTRNWLMAMLAYRVASFVFHEVVKGITEAKDALFDLEKQASRVQRVLGDRSRPLITTGISSAVTQYGVTPQQAGEAAYQQSAFEKDPVTSLKELDTTLKLVKGTEADARDTARLLTQMYNLFGDQIKDTTDKAEKYRRMGELVAIAWKSTQTEVPELIQSFKYLASSFTSLGVPVEQQVSTLAYLDYVGQRSTTAGTGLRKAMEDIIEGANKQDSAMQKLLVKTKEGGLDLHKTLLGIAQVARTLFEKEGLLASEAFLKSIFPDIRGRAQVRAFIASFQDIGTGLGKQMSDNMAQAFKGRTDENSKIFKASMDNIGDQISRAWNSMLQSMARSFSDFARDIHLTGFFKDVNSGFENEAKQAVYTRMYQAATTPQAKNEALKGLAETVTEGTPISSELRDILTREHMIRRPNKPTNRGLFDPWMSPDMEWQWSYGNRFAPTEGAVQNQGYWVDRVGRQHPGTLPGIGSLTVIPRGGKAPAAVPVSPEIAKIAADELKRQHDERQKEIDRKQHEADMKRLKVIEAQHMVSEAELRSLQQRMQDEPGLAASAKFQKQLKEVSERSDKEQMEILRLKKEGAAAEKLAQLEGLQSDKVERERKKIVKKDSIAALEKTKEAVEAQAESARALFDAMKQGTIPRLGQGSFYDKELMDQAKRVDELEYKAQAIGNQILEAQGKPGKSMLPWQLKTKGEVPELERARTHELEQFTTQYIQSWKDYFRQADEDTKESLRVEREERNTRLEAIRERQQTEAADAELGYRPYRVYPGDTPRSEEARRYVESRQRALLKMGTLVREREGYEAEKLPETVGNLAENLKIDKRIASVNRELMHMRDTLQDIEDTHAGESMRIFRDELTQYYDRQRFQSDIDFSGPVAPGAGNELRRNMRRLYRERGIAVGELMAQGMAGASPEVLERLQQVLDRIDADIRNAPLSQFYSIKGQIQNQVSSTVVAMWRGGAGLGTLTRSLGDTLVEKAITVQAEKLFDPLITAVSKQVYTLETNTDAISTLTAAITGSSSGNGSAAGVPAGAAAVGGLVGALAAASGGKSGGTTSYYRGSPANRPLSKRNFGDIASAGLAAYSIFSQGQETGVTLGGVLGGAMTGFAFGGPIGAAIGGGLSLLGGLFGGHKRTPPGPASTQEPAFFNAPSNFDYWAYRYRATGTLPSMGEMHARQGVAPIVNVYIDGAKSAARVEIAQQGNSSRMAAVSAFLDLHKPY